MSAVEGEGWRTQSTCTVSPCHSVSFSFYGFSEGLSIVCGHYCPEYISASNGLSAECASRWHATAVKASIRNLLRSSLKARRKQARRRPSIETRWRGRATEALRGKTTSNSGRKIGREVTRHRAVTAASQSGRRYHWTPTWSTRYMGDMLVSLDPVRVYLV